MIRIKHVLFTSNNCAAKTIVISRCCHGKVVEFHDDIVVVAVQVETEVDVEKLSHDNKTLKDRCVALEDQNHRVQDELRRLHVKTETKLAAPARSDLRDRMLSSFDHDIALLACGRTLGGGGPEAKSSSVKNLIATIEEQVQVVCNICMTSFATIS